jgi:crotonobetainyl-CoA:carnitine CoA-transferase CaiB-like acyl-CoA transferase
VIERRDAGPRRRAAAVERSAARARRRHPPGRRGTDADVGAQPRGLPCGIIYAPDEVLSDPHLVARGFPVTVQHDGIGRDVTYPGAPFAMPRSPWRIRRHAPRVGAHQDEILGPAAPDVR